MALFGHIAFCTTEVKGDILTNFGDNLAAQTTRIGSHLPTCTCTSVHELMFGSSGFLGFTVAVLISFPFMVTPCRACVYSVLFNRVRKKNPLLPHLTQHVQLTMHACFFLAPGLPGRSQCHSSEQVCCHYCWHCVHHVVHCCDHTQRWALFAVRWPSEIACTFSPTSCS